MLAAARTFFLAGGYRSLLQRVDAASGPVEALVAPSRVGFGVQPASQVKTSKGLVAIAHLVSNAHRVVSAAELAAVVDGRDAATIAAMTARSWEHFAMDADVDAGSDVGDAMRRVLFDEAIRSRVSKLLRRTIANLSASHRLVGEHLAASVVTGHGCRYRPIGALVTWRVERSD